MVSKVIVENPCGCFFKSGLPEEQEFQDRSAAKDEAQAFAVLPSGTNYKVVISPRT